MPRVTAWIVVLACSTAVADDGPTGLSARAERWTRDRGPLLHIEGGPPVASLTAGTAIEREGFVARLGRRVRLAGQGSWWQATIAPDMYGAEIEDVARGWSAGYQLSYDLGPFQVGASVGMGGVDGRYQSGTYRHVGASIFRTFRLARWMHAWISLGIGQRTWLGDAPPAGEAKRDTTLGLSIGTTFR